MNVKKRLLIVPALLALILAGCSRTVEDVAKWEAKGDTGKLTEALTDPKFEVRQAAAESLGSLQAEDAVGELAACLNDDEAAVQLAAIHALAAIGTPGTVTPLIAAFKLDHMEARLMAAESLGNLKAEAAVDTLAEALNETDETIQLVACETLGRIESPAGSKPLANKLADTTAPIKLRLACIDALAGTGGEVALGALVEGLADDDERIREAATTSLIKIGRPAVPSMIKGLRSKDTMVRSASIKLLRGLNAIPTRGEGLVWYQLARSSMAENAETQQEAIDLLVTKGDPMIPTLIEAASLDVADLREAAAQALEGIGESALNEVMKAAEQVVMFETREWFKARSSWTGAPSPLLDLFAAVSMLNPDFEAKQDTQTILFGSDPKPERSHIPTLVNLLDNSASREQAIKRLEAAGGSATLPLIAAITSTNTAIAEAAAEILSDRRDMRTFQPLVDAVQMRLDAGEALSQSTLYTALLKLDQLDAEPLLLKIRPNTERALMVFSKQYRDAKIIGIETTDPYTDNEAPVIFHIGYTLNDKPGTLEVTFKKDAKGNWRPSPALPYALSKPEKPE